MSDKLRVDAYYYGFDETGCKEIDLILSAVACAGKAFHHTNAWMDETRPYPPHEGQCPVDWVQNAAEKAAARIKELEAERDALKKALKPFACTLERYSGFTDYALFGIWEDVNGAAGRKLNILRYPDFQKAQTLVKELDDE